MSRKIDPTKRTSILSAGRNIFLRDGYAAAKMSDIAAEAGVAPGTVYLYFDSKEALASAIGEDFFCRLSDEFTEVIKKLEKPSGIHDLVKWALRIGTEERDLLALIKTQLPHPTVDCEADDGPRVQFLRRLAQALERLQTKEHARKYDSFALANVVMSVLQGLTMACVFSSTDTEQMQAAAVKVLQHALFEDDAIIDCAKSQSDKLKSLAGKAARKPETANLVRHRK